MSRLADSLKHGLHLLAKADLASDEAVRELLELTHERRQLDLSDLSPSEQAALIAERCQQLQPSEEALAERVARAARQGRPLVAKLGIDPTGAEVHLGHAVPMLLLSRLQRFGHRVVLIVGDFTAKIGDPSGRSEERPPLTDQEIANNLTTYRQQVAPFFDFSRAELRYNGDWLRQVSLSRLIEICAHIPVSMSLQREDFRSRLAAGHSLSLAEALYSVAMALDSVELNCDIEVGGVDQYLNMQMCRQVMEICGQEPELVAATPLIEGTDGTGAKMSKSQGNYVPLTAPPGEVFGKLMSIPDRLVEPYLKALSEWQGPELATAAARLSAGSLHPMDAKKILAGEVTAALHGIEAAMVARADFAAHFSAHRYDEVAGIPSIDDVSQTVLEAVRKLGFATSNSEVRRVAGQKGLRLVTQPARGRGPKPAGEPGRGRPAAGLEEVVLRPDDIRKTLKELIESTSRAGTGSGPSYYLKVGRKLARVLTA
jgi:tyrosyl-tRNA synthetase